MNDPIRGKWDDWYFDEESYRSDSLYQSWLDVYIDWLPNNKIRSVLDLGCGRGFDTQFLVNVGIHPISVDYSWGALQAAKKTEPTSKLTQFDMREPFPIKTRSFGMVIADLSLHYFPQEKTQAIIGEIYRVLIPGGWLIARVNSTRDLGFQKVNEEDGLRLEENYFLYHDIPRRFFTEESIRSFFPAGWTMKVIQEKDLMRYAKHKILWEFAVQKNQ